MSDSEPKRFSSRREMRKKKLTSAHGTKKKALAGYKAEKIPLKRREVSNVNPVSRQERKASKPRKDSEYDSRAEGETYFAKLIEPVSVDTFFDTIWEKKPLCITRRNLVFFKHICTLQDFKDALDNEDVHFGRNIDVTSYVNGVKANEGVVGRATKKAVFRLYDRGRSIRLLNPQTFLKNVRCFTSRLQILFRCFVGANIYLTPPYSQGFAPHYDDVEAFVLQLHGKKEWRVYKPRPSEELPRFSSKNLTDGDIGDPILKIVLQPGDLLYFPRGFIHQARSLDEGSMHITVSCYQRNAWADLLEKLLPVTLQIAIQEDLEYRRGLPLDYLDHLGIVASDSDCAERRRIIAHVKRLVSKLTHYLPIDGCADQLGKNFMHDSLPPVLNQDELDRTASHLCSGSILAELKRQWNRQLQIKLIRAYSCRVVFEEEELKLYYRTRNGLTYHEAGNRFMKLTNVGAIIMDMLLKRYPEFTDLRELIDAVDGSRGWRTSFVLKFVNRLWKRGLILLNRSLRDCPAAK